MIPQLFRIEGLHWETGTGDVFTWALQAEEDTPFSFEPGQFNMLYAFGVGEVPISICSDPNGSILQHTIRAAGSVTRAMHRLRPGDQIGLRGPFGSAWPVLEAQGKDLLIMAGGIGLAPLKPVIYSVMQQREKYQNVTVLYGARTPMDILYRSELEAWQASGEIDLVMTVDRAAESWRGHVGVVTHLLAQANFDSQQTLVMLCGPEMMIRFSELALQKVGIARDAIYVSLERNMKCAVGHCGHCQLGPYFICKEGPVFRLDAVDPFLQIRTL